MFQFRSDGGNDVITNFTSNDTLYISAGSFNGSTVNGNDLIIGAKGTSYSGTIRLLGAANIPVKLKDRNNAVQTINSVNFVNNIIPNDKVDGTNSRDVVSNYASGAKIDARSDNDTVLSIGDNVSIEGGLGNDSLRSIEGRNVTIHGGGGNDTLTGSSDFNSIFQFRSDGGNDVITNFGVNDTLHITAGGLNGYTVSGNDLIVGAKGTSYSGTIRLLGAANSFVKVKVGSGAVQTINNINRIDHDVNDVIVNGSSNQDSVFNRASYVTINAVADNDTIINVGDYVLVNGGAGADLIRSTGGSYVTLHGGTGNDTLTGSSSAEVFQYRSDGGADIITNFDSSDTLHITAGSLSGYTVNGNDMLIGAKGVNYSGTICLLNYGDKSVRIKIGSGSIDTINAVNTISNHENTIVRGTDSKDYIHNDSFYATIDAGAGNDIIEVDYYEYYVLDIPVVSVNGDSGDDYIGGYFNYSTLKGGTGNDVIIKYWDEWNPENNIIQFASNEGNDQIYGFTENDTLYITAGSIAAHYSDGYDYIISLQGAKYSGSVTLCDAIDIPIQVRTASGTIETLNDGTIDYTSGTIISGTSRADNIFNVNPNMTINASAGNDTVYNSSRYTSINGSAGNDYICGYSPESTLQAGAGNDSIGSWGDYKTYQFGSADGHDVIINFSNHDTLQITEGAIASYYADNADLFVSVKGSTRSGSIIIKDAALTPIQVRNASGAVSTINTFNVISNSRSNTLIVGMSSNDSIRNSSSYVTIEARDGNDQIYNSSLGYGSIDGGNGNDSIVGYFYHSTINAGAGNDTINKYGGNENVIRLSSDGGHDLILGLSANDTLNIMDGSIVDHYSTGHNYVVSLQGEQYLGAVTLQSAIDNVPIQILDASDRVSILNYDIANSASDKVIGTSKAKHIFNNGSTAVINASAGDDSICNHNGDNTTINAGTGDDSVYNYNGDNMTINVGRGNDSIYNYRGNYVSINGDAGDDSIYNYEGNNMAISAGAGDDTIYSYNGNYVSIYGGVGNDSIYNRYRFSGTYNNNSARHSVIDTGAGDDTIFNTVRYSLLNSGSGDDSILSSGLYSTVESGAGNDFIDNGGHYSYVKSGSSNDTIEDDSSRSSINSEAGDDYICGTSPGSTLRGNKGNDTITTSGDYKTYLFSSADGHDVITNFSAHDTLRLTAGSIVSHYFDGDDFIANVKGVNYSGSVTFKDVGLIPVRVVDTKGKVSILNHDISNAASNMLIDGTSGIDRIFNESSMVTIRIGAGNDMIYNHTGDYVAINAGAGNDSVYTFAGDYVSIDTGVGNDSIHNLSGDHAVINAGAGNDYVYNDWGRYASINGGAGNDYIYGDMYYAAIRGGAGNDTIEAKDNITNSGFTTYQFSSSDGYDLITNFYSHDTIAITSGSITANYRSGSDYIIEVGSSAAITVQDAAYQAIKVKLANGSMTTLNSNSYELPASEAFEEYWFEQIDQTDQSTQALDELNSILQSEQFDRAVDFDPDPISDQFKPKLELVSNFARSRLKK